ncbi:intercellular trafficking and secretion [Saitoella coloradoensis]
MADFDSVQWDTIPPTPTERHDIQISEPDQNPTEPRAAAGEEEVREAYTGRNVLECKVDSPQKELEGHKDAFVSYLVTTHTTFSAFQKQDLSVRRRFTDFVFLHNVLVRDYPACAIPPLPQKHNMEYIKGDRFASAFTLRRANSLNTFLTRLTLHPILRRTPALHTFLESQDWHAYTKKNATARATNGSDSGSGVFEGFGDALLNAFTKINKPDKKFIDVKEKAEKLDEDLGHIEKLIARVARRTADLQSDFSDMANQIQKLNALELALQKEITAFSDALTHTSTAIRDLYEITDAHYLTSLQDMSAYLTSVKSLLKQRDQKQMDYEGLMEFLQKTTIERDQLASSHHTSFIRGKVEDLRGVDHEQSRKDRLKKLEFRIEELKNETETARLTTEAFDEEVIKEAEIFEEIKAREMRSTLREYAVANVRFYQKTIEQWERLQPLLHSQNGQAAEAD